MHVVDLPGEWYGWRLRGRYLVSPDGERITRARLDGLLWRDGQELRLAGFASRRAAEEARRRSAAGPRVKVVIVDLAEVRVKGRTAG